MSFLQLVIAFMIEINGYAFTNFLFITFVTLKYYQSFKITFSTHWYMSHGV